MAPLRPDQLPTSSLDPRHLRIEQQRTPKEGTQGREGRLSECEEGVGGTDSPNPTGPGQGLCAVQVLDPPPAIPCFTWVCNFPGPMDPPSG